MRIYGKNSVLERMRVNPSTIRKIYIQEGFNEASLIRSKASKLGLTVISIPATKMLKIARNTNTQGILVEVTEFEYVPYNDLLTLAEEKRLTPVFLDGLTDPQNLGAIIRSLACLGGFAIVLPTHDSVHITDSVLRVASGGDNYVPVAKVPNLNNAIRSAKESGFSIWGAVVGGGQSINETRFPLPVGLVVGSEQKGIRDIIRKQLDGEVTIPMPFSQLSFNVAQATTILAYEIAKQKKQQKNS